MGDVVSFPGVTVFTAEDNEDFDHNVEEVLEGAIEADLKEVIIVGKDQDDAFFVSSSTASLGKIMLYLELAKKNYLEIID